MDAVRVALNRLKSAYHVTINTLAATDDQLMDVSRSAQNVADWLISAMNEMEERVDLFGDAVHSVPFLDR